MRKKMNDQYGKNRMPRSLFRVGGLVCLMLLIMGAALTPAQAGTTGKISGTVIEEATGEPMIGVNVLVEGTTYGAATDLEGYYHILNIPPGTYTVVARMIGYSEVKMQEVRVNVDLTTKINFTLKEQVLEGEEVVVVAERPMVQRDLTSKASNISADEIKALPVDNFDEVVELQAGVVDGHFRGGRSGEVAYMVDGIPVNDPYNNSRGIEVENTSIQQLEVISGTFNAEYGQAMSGVVNIITRDGGSDYEVELSSYTGTYYTTHEELHPNLDNVNSGNVRNAQLTVSGPVPFLNDLKFFTTARFLEDDGHLYGRRLYQTSDDNPFLPTGNMEYVPMNNSERMSFHGKLSYNLTPAIKLSGGFMMDDNENRYYNHAFRLTPEGPKTHYRTNYNVNFQVNHTLSNNTYHTVKVSQNESQYEGYVYEDPNDSAYLDTDNGQPASNYTFRSGGNEDDRYDRTTTTTLGKWDLSSQVTKIHKIGVGAVYKTYELYNFWTSLDTENSTEGELVYPAEFTPGREEYTKKPFEFAFYVQDKVEFENFIINAGLRYDYFDPNTNMPADTRNPELISLFPSESTDAKVKSQLSPRLGVAFPITAQGVIHVSYGHFLQIPNFELLYEGITDSAGVSKYYLPRDANLSTIKGNPDLESQQTVMYEVGLQQGLTDNLAFDFTAYYRDIRNLVGTEIVETYDTKKYARYVNRDYGNIRGIILSLEKRLSDYWGARVDYTYQLAEGNASDPQSVFLDNQSDPPRESEKKLIPLDWDQRHTLNIALNTGVQGNWNLGLIGTYGSGTPYTASSRFILGNVNFRNNRNKPDIINFDLQFEKYFKFSGTRMSTFIWVENLFDRKNEYNVYGSTGSADFDLEAYLSSGDILGLHTLEDYITNPSNYSAPRRIRLGLSVQL